MTKYKIILASNSPRRKQLLDGLGIPFEVRVLDGIDESFPSDMTMEEIPKYIASRKADVYAGSLADDELVITADTIVYCDGEVLGKPKDRDDAYRMLRKLSGKHHHVVTGVCLVGKKLHHEFSVVTEVTFKDLSDDEINFYIDNYKPFDKAGAYGIQEWIGYIGVTGIHGSYFNVMGFPIQRVYEELKMLDKLKS